jgi:transcriptional regulator with XRE-family HTH domain
MLEERLKSLRKEHGYTMKELAHKLSLSESVISLYENGKRQPSYDILIKLAHVYTVTLDYLLGINKEEPNKSVKREVIDDSIELIQKPPFPLTESEITQIRDFIQFIRHKRENK